MAGAAEEPGGFRFWLRPRAGPAFPSYLQPGQLFHMLAAGAGDTVTGMRWGRAVRFSWKARPALEKLASGADVFFDVTTQKSAAQAIKKSAEIGWKPIHLLNSISASVGSVLNPAGMSNASGILTAA
jgi:hypothetical protein